MDRWDDGHGDKGCRGRGALLLVDGDWQVMWAVFLP